MLSDFDTPIKGPPDRERAQLPPLFFLPPSAPHITNPQIPPSVSGTPSDHYSVSQTPDPTSAMLSKVPDGTPRITLRESPLMCAYMRPDICAYTHLSLRSSPAPLIGALSLLPSQRPNYEVCHCRFAPLLDVEQCLITISHPEDNEEAKRPFFSMDTIGSSCQRHPHLVLAQCWG